MPKVLDRPKPKVLGKTAARIYTPPLAHHCDEFGELLDEFTDGPAAIAFAETVLGIVLFPWQKWLLNHALELSDELTDDGLPLLRFRIVITMVARQNGKTTVENILALWHMFSLESGLVIGTAQSLDRSEEAWKDCLALAELAIDQYGDELPEIDESNFGHPKYFNLDNGCEYRVTAASRRGGRGFSGDLILMDELREHHTFDSWSSVTNTMNARQLAQAWAFSNAGDLFSVVLRYQRALAHRELGWPDGDDDADLLGDSEDMFKDMGADELPDNWDEITTGFFEWSVPPKSRRADVEALAWANPSLNHTEVTPNCPTTRSLYAKLKADPPLEFDQEVRCLFVGSDDGGPFPEGSWDATTSETASPGEDADIIVCVEVSSRRDATFVSRVGRYTDEGGRDIAVLGISHDYPGTDWVKDLLLDTRESYVSIVVRTEPGSPALNLFEDLQELEVEHGEFEGEGLPLVEWKGSDIQAAFADMHDRLAQKRIEHLPHRGLDLSATSATRKEVPGGGFRVDILNSPSDTAPLYSAVGAVWGLDHLDDNVSMYATETVMTLQRRNF